MQPSSFLWLAALAALMSFVVAIAAESGSGDDKDRAIDILSTEGQHGWLEKVLQVGRTGTSNLASYPSPPRPPLPHPFPIPSPPIHPPLPVACP